MLSKMTPSYKKYRAITVEYTSDKGGKGAKIRLIDEGSSYEDNSITADYDHKSGIAIQQAIRILRDRGFYIVGVVENSNQSFVIVDNI